MINDSLFFLGMTALKDVFNYIIGIIIFAPVDPDAVLLSFEPGDLALGVVSGTCLDKIYGFR